MDEAGEKLKRAFTGAFALLFAVIVLCAVFCNQNVFGTQSPRSLLAGGLALAVGVLCAAWLLRLLPAPGKRLRRTLLAAFFTLCFLAQAHVGRALVVGATGDWDFGIVLRWTLRQTVRRAAFISTISPTTSRSCCCWQGCSVCCGPVV